MEDFSLQTVALAATDMPVVGGMSPPQKPIPLCWVTVWAHFCELGRVRKDIKGSDLEDLMTCRFSDLKREIAVEVHRLAESSEHVKDCHAVRVVAAAIAHRSRKPRGPTHCLGLTHRLRKKTKKINIRTACTKTRIQLVSLAEGKSRRDRVTKAIVICNLCGNQIRRDNIARHRGSQFCKNRSRAHGLT